jgi:hypothetical protein
MTALAAGLFRRRRLERAAAHRPVLPADTILALLSSFAALSTASFPLRLALAAGPAAFTLGLAFRSLTRPGPEENRPSPRQAPALFALAVVTLGTIAVLATPIDYSLVEAHRPAGKVIEWQWVRLISPVVNLYAFVLLAGSAAWSAWRFTRIPGQRHRAVGNVLISVGAILPGIGGSFTRFGHVEVLYVTELAGLLLIYAGYRLATRESGPSLSSPQNSATPHVSLAR